MRSASYNDDKCILSASLLKFVHPTLKEDKAKLHTSIIYYTSMTATENATAVYMYMYYRYYMYVYMLLSMLISTS